ncbi:hypothetical protein ABL78_5698 [Leptomonas seymouri]|uniref:F-box domain-containing protein n=1 Tax=Leptomonas seymouri TaxID=5684 RepID=A0A0N1HWH7_LEPSE|nr:hypothetical protein ABL78_5698 [Leptomonas seymouri]|eukprot:KPI85245.1 hypothetical protein ABL78_5698 [Leptomonas seymouri]
MSTWASRLSTSAKSATPSPVIEGSSERHRPGASPSSSSVIAPPQNSGPETAAMTANDAMPSAVREEFRLVAEKYNEESVCMLRLPPDCWDLLTQYLPYADVVALGQTCRSLWVVLHQRDSIWWRQLAYFHHDVRGLRGGKLLCTAPLFPRPPPDASTSQSESLIPSPTTTPSSSTAAGADGRPHPFTARLRCSGEVPMSAYERFFQERRVYVLDAHREWHFQELADVDDKSTGMFTVALHDGKAKSLHTSISADAASLSFASSFESPSAPLPRTTASMATTPILAASDSANSTLLNAPPSPTALLLPQAGRGSSLSTPAAATFTPHRRTTPNQTPGTSASNSPALAPSPTPPAPSLLPRVGDPIINEHNPLLQLRIYTIDVHGTERQLYEADDYAEEGGKEEDCGAGTSGRHMSGLHGPLSLAAEPPVNMAGMSEDEVLAYVMQLSLQEAQAAVRNSSLPTHATEPVASSHDLPQGSATKTATAAKTSTARRPRSHYRGAPGSQSLPLSELLIVIDSINNNALDQLHHHQVRDCTADEDPYFLLRLSETLRSAKHRRLHLGNHHRAVRNNGQTTRNRAGGGVSSPNPQQPPPPPPMNRMLRGFHGDLLEITEREARMVANKLLGKPNLIDDFVVFHCYDPNELHRRLHPTTTSSTDAAPAATRAPTTASTVEMNHSSATMERQVANHGTLVSVPAPLYVDCAAGDAIKVIGAPAPLSLAPARCAYPPVSLRTVMLAPPLRALPFFTRFFLAPELCHDGYIALLVVDVVRALVVVEKEAVSSDNPDWASPLIHRGGRVVVPGQGYNPQAYTRSEYNYVPPNPPRRQR